MANSSSNPATEGAAFKRRSPRQAVAVRAPIAGTALPVGAMGTRLGASHAIVRNP
jgi:hypothetical protein